MIFLSVRGYGKLQNVSEKSGKSQGILKLMISGNPVKLMLLRCHSAKVLSTTVGNSIVAVVTDLWHYLTCDSLQVRCYMKCIQ